MKRSALLLMCCALLLVSCNEKVNNAKTIEGCWICTDFNNLTIPTDRMLAMSFEANGKAVYCQGVTKDASHAEFVSSLMRYQLDEESFSIYGLFPEKDSLKMQFDIVSLSKDKLIANLTNVNNQKLVDRPLGKYTFTKVTTADKYLNSIQGEWEGYRHQSGDKFDSIPSIKMKFAGKNGFVFSKPFNGHWNDCTGTFMLFGEKMAVNYATEVSSYYNCWEIASLNTKEMMLRKYNAESDTASMLDVVRFKMVKL